MADQIKLQTVTPQTVIDWHELRSLIGSAFAYMDSRIDPPSSLHRMTAADLEQKATTETLIVAKHNNRLVGCIYCRCEDEHLYIGKFSVDLDHQGAGIGKGLMQAAQELAFQENLAFMMLETRIELVENHRMFARFGFVKSDETAHEGYNSPTAITMTKALC